MEKFNVQSEGYDIKQVNSFVRNVTNEYESMLNKLKNRDQEIYDLKEKLKHYKDLETTLNKAVLIAEDSSNQIKKIAHDEAKLIVDTAKKNASQIVNDALIKAEKTELEADNLRRSLKVYKARIKQAVEAQLTIVNDVDEIKIEDNNH